MHESPDNFFGFLAVKASITFMKIMRLQMNNFKKCTVATKNILQIRCATTKNP